MIKILDTVQNQDVNVLREQFALDVLKGLSAERKSLSSKYFYDDTGSILFEKITQIAEYYPTQCEAEIFETYKGTLARFFRNSVFNLIELGAGDGKKTKILLEEFHKAKLDFEYISIDISEGAVRDLDSSLAKKFPEMRHTGVVGEYIDSIKWIEGEKTGTKLILFLGSNIGNFDKHAAQVFLRVLWRHMNHGDYLLIGFDLKKDIRTMANAYNDSGGITQQFNLNLLSRMNRELGADFVLENFMHYGLYNPRIGAMESYLISTREQVVKIDELEKRFFFDEFEPIHLEYSNKYLISDVENYANETGFEVEEHFYDEKKFYVDSLWRVKKEIR